jgi:carbonic anhydrase
MQAIKQLLLENKAWARGKLDNDPEFFKKGAKEQKPDYLWIGCSDSRVHPSELTNTDPGQIFVHRNIANLVVHTDLNLQSVLSFAVHNLKVNHIIVCGHYNCGGVKAALSNQSLGLIDHWVRNIKEVYFTNKLVIDSVKDATDRVNKLVELSVIKQVEHLAHSSIVQAEWKNRPYPYIHGWIYDLNTGLLKELVTISPDSQLDSAFSYNFS